MSKLVVIAFLLFSLVVSRNPQVLGGPGSIQFKEPKVQGLQQSLPPACMAAVGRSFVGLRKIVKSVIGSNTIEPIDLETIKKQLNVGNACDGLKKTIGIDMNSCSSILINLLETTSDKLKGSKEKPTSADFLSWIADSNVSKNMADCYDDEVAKKNTKCYKFLSSALENAKNKFFSEVAQGNSGSTALTDLTSLPVLISLAANCGNTGN